MCSLYVELMDWLVQLVECNLFVLSWILGRQTMACLLSCSRQLMSAAPPMQMQAAILHEVTQRQPLGRYLCAISVTWLFSNIHKTNTCSKCTINGAAIRIEKRKGQDQNSWMFTNTPSNTLSVSKLLFLDQFL